MRANPPFPPPNHVLQARFYPAIMNNDIKNYNFKNIITIQKEKYWIGAFVSVKSCISENHIPKNIIPRNV